MENIDNWGPDIIKLPVMRWVDKDAPELGVMLTDTFTQFAKKNGFSYVGFQFKKGNPKDLFMADSINCTPAEFGELVEAIKEEFNKKEAKEEE